MERSIYTNDIKSKLYITNQTCWRTRSTLWKGNHSSAQSVCSCPPPPPTRANKSASAGCKHNDTRTFDGAVIIQQRLALWLLIITIAETNSSGFQINGCILFYPPRRVYKVPAQCHHCPSTKLDTHIHRNVSIRTQRGGS